MANQYNNKVILKDGTVLIDLTQDDVKEEHVQKGIKFHDKSGAQKTGTNTKTVDASEATADAPEVLEGETFGKGSSLVTGTMPNRGAVEGTISSATEKYTILRGYHDGSGKVGISPEELAKLIPGNIKQGVTLLGVPGEFGSDDFKAQAKEVTPSFIDQQIEPDSGYTFLTGVLVRAIPVTRQDNSAGGVTVTIG